MARAFTDRFGDKSPPWRGLPLSSTVSCPAVSPTQTSSPLGLISMSQYSGIRPNPPTTSIIQNPTSTQPPPNKSAPLLPTPVLPTRHLTPTELRDKRERGLCYNCDEKFSPNHRCRSRYLLLLGCDECDEEDTTVEAPPEATAGFVEEISGDISTLHALSCLHQGKSLRVFGTHGVHRFQVLIDSGSTRNFIKSALVEQLGLRVILIPHFRVSTSSGAFLFCQYSCPAIVLVLQEISFTLDLFVLAIEGPDVVLGFPWLQLLGRVSHDYSTLTMEFWWQGQHHTLTGETSNLPTPVSLHQLQALVMSRDSTQLFELTSSPVD